MHRPKFQMLVTPTPVHSFGWNLVLWGILYFWYCGVFCILTIRRLYRNFFPFWRNTLSKMLVSFNPRLQWIHLKIARIKIWKATRLKPQRKAEIQKRKFQRHQWGKQPKRNRPTKSSKTCPPTLAICQNLWKKCSRLSFLLYTMTSLKNCLMKLQCWRTLLTMLSEKTNYWKPKWQIVCAQKPKIQK